MPTDLPQVARVTLSGTYNGEKFANVLHFVKRDATDITASNLAALHGVLDDPAADNDAWLHILQRMDTAATVDTISSISLANTSPVALTSTVSLSGSSGGTDAPPLLAVVVKWTTQVATRRTRGRTYLPGVNTGMFQSDADRLDTTFAANVATSAADFVTAWLANVTWAFIILSDTARQANDPIPFEEVVGSSVNPLFGVQRRRRQWP